MVKHVLESQQFDVDFLTTLFARTKEIKRLMQSPEGRAGLAQTQRNKLIAMLFYEPSTRTRMSFDAAAKHLGASVVATENAKEFSSAAKGETIEDTVNVLSEYLPDAIIIRHYETGTAQAASIASRRPIINAGDGKGQHPTQALLDLYTIQDEIGRLDNLNVVIGGDLKHGRTVRSLAYLLAKFKNNSITFISPKELMIEDDIKEYLNRHKVPFKEVHEINGSFESADVVYWTRIQKERFDASKLTTSFVITPKEMVTMKKSCILMHPLPRVDEITTDVDKDPRAAYFRQAGNGMYVRMALLGWVLD